MDQANESPGVFPTNASGVPSPQHSISTELGSLRMLSMSTFPNNEQFTVSEKIELLVNILQQIQPDLSSYLLHLILVELQGVPRWLDIPLPKGRSLHACQIAFEEMRRQSAQQPGPPRPFLPTTYANIAPAPTSRSFSEQDPHLLTRRQIVPRPPIRATESPNPPVTNGESTIYARTTFPDQPTPEPSKKRGRPSKAAVEERERKLALEGKIYVPKKRPNKRIRPSFEPDAVEPMDEESTLPVFQTPTTRTAELVEETSSGKRRRRARQESPTAGFSAGAELHEAEETREPEPNVAESPSDRLLASHRDRGSVGSSLSRRTQGGSDTQEVSQTEPD